MGKYIIKSKNKYKIVIIFALLCIFSLFIKGIYTDPIVNAEGGWAIGDNGTIGKDPTPTSYGATAWPIGNGILIGTQELYKYADKNGRDIIIKEVDSLSPNYTDNTVAIIPYELHKYMDDHNYDSIYVVKRPDTVATNLQKLGKPEYTGAVIRMERKPKSEDFAEIDYLHDGIFYKKLWDLSGHTSKKALIGKKWKEALKENKSTYISRCKVLWSYLTLVENNKYNVTDRIDKYIHASLIGNNYNNLANVKSEKMREFEFRYLDFLMTIYTMCNSNTNAAKHWESVIDEYVNGLTLGKITNCNVIISPSVAARGEIEKNKYYNIIAGCQDYLDFTIGVDRKYYSLGQLSTADTVEESLVKSKKGTNYYNRLLESIRLSLVYQSKNHIKVNRTYTGSGLFASNVVSRLIAHKPIINGNSVSYKDGNWSSQRIVENISLKDNYFGLSLIPAIDGSAPGYKATLTVGSTKSGYEGQKRIPIYNETVLNDSSRLTINLESEISSSDEWKRIFKNYKYHKVQVKITRTPPSPTISLEPKTYISKPDEISGKELESILFNSEKTLPQWLDTSLNAVPINEKEIKKYIYKAGVTIYYSNTTKTPAEMESIAVETNEASIIYEKKETKLYASYVSEPDGYSELKEGGIYNETFEAMAGVPTTRKLYFASGGSEFMVELEVMYDKDKTATRTYRSYFKGGVDCEFKEGDTAKPQSLGDQTADLHNGGTYTKTWTGSIPNEAEAVTKLHSASCPAKPNYDEYDAVKEEAQAFADEVNDTKLSYTSASDKKTREFNNWNARITTDSKNPPQTTSASVSCSKRDPDENGNGGAPCGNEMATANPGGDGSFSITVTWTVPAHVICGPCCSHVLNSVEDTWNQKSSFDTLKITDVRVWKIDSSYVGGMQEITYDEDAFVKATIKQGDPNIFYNVAATDTSKDGRLRYSLQQQQHDAVTWYETSDIGESRSNKCDGQSGTLCSQNPIQVAKNQGHVNSWSKGILYNNTTYANDVDHHKVSSGTKSTVTNNSTDSVDKGSLEYIRFNERRNQDNTMTMISDMLILQTSSGDQSVLYFDTKQTKKAQVNFDDIEIKFEELWKDNQLSASTWKADSINIGSYNGNYNKTSTKYEGTGKKEQIETAFDNDAAKTTSGDELGKARVVSSMSFTNGSENKSSPSIGQARMVRPTGLRIFIDKIRQNPINPNKEYFTGQSYVYYRNILSLTDTKNTIKLAVAHNDELTTNDMGDYGYTIKSRYRITDSKEGNVNSIVVQNPVSVEDARIVSLPEYMDQRTTIPEGSAKDLLQDIAASQVCPLSPGLCEFRKLNCNYYSESVKASFDFEKISTLELAEGSSNTGNDSNNDSDSEEIIQEQLVFQDFETNNYNITAKNNCKVSTSKERLVVEVTGKDSSIEVPVNFDSSNIVSAKVYFGTSGSSKTSRMYWEGTKNSSSINTNIKPETINQTATFNLSTNAMWKQSGKITKIRLNFDGDNTGDGVYIISKIEFIQQGSSELEDGVFTGSEDDKTIIRSLLKTVSGETMDYDLPAGFSIKEDNSVGFGSGRYLHVDGKRLPIGLSELGLDYDKNLRVKLEANLYIPSVSSSNRMLFSFHNLGFYIPSGQTYGAFTTGNGVEKRANCNLVGSKVRLGIVFSFGSIEDCEIYINGQKLDSYSKVNNSNIIDEETIGDSVNIGCWTKNDSYISNFYLDNLTIIRMPGTSTHTASCYTIIKEHSYTKQYTCNSKLDLNHVHNDSCTYKISQDNTHVHTADCFDIDEDALQTAYDQANNGDTDLIKNMLGPKLYEEFESSMLGVKKDFEYTGSAQTFTAPVTGYYMLETWGAEGGKGDGGINPAGLGGYSKGTIKLTKGQTVQVNVGEYGGTSPNNTPAFNGGGASFNSTGHNGGRGGGATDLRIPGAVPNKVIAELNFDGNNHGVTNGTDYVSSNNGTALIVNKGNNDGYIYCNGGSQNPAYGKNTADIDTVEVRIKNNTNGNFGHIYFGTSSKGWTYENGGRLDLPALSIYDTEYKTYRVKIDKNVATSWGSGTITGLRFDFANGGTAGGTYEIDYVKFISTAGDDTRVIVAGGGGGAMSTCGGTAATAGHGGGIEGVHSENTAGTYVGNIAYGGTQTAGGSYRPGSTNYAPSNGSGSLGMGANAGTCGAGGGGGYYGGGTVYTAGGGGGSGYIGGVINGSMTTGVRIGNGKASITYLDATSVTDSRTEFAYTSGVQTFIAPVAGVYTLEVWGAQGGAGSGYQGGQGGYSKGDITLSAGQAITIYVGGQGGASTGGWNGGGNAVGDGCGSAGGGATDIRIGGSSINNRVIVAGGGGGGSQEQPGGNGGGTSGISVTYAVGGTQSSGSTLGQGGADRSGDGAGGGGGYYGGYGSSHADYAGAGGSGYVGGVTNGTTQVGGNIGHGKAAITYVGKGAYSEQNFGYTGNVQAFTAPVSGEYTLEVWGAQGGSSPGYGIGGKGGYSKGAVNLKAKQTIYIYVGQVGVDGGSGNRSSFNGGAAPYTNHQYTSGGGGATDIRTIGGAWSDASGLGSRIIVAGGGGGGGAEYGSNYEGGGAGGGIVGGNGYQTNVTPGQIGIGGTQTNSGGPGYGGFGYGGVTTSSQGGSGGGGWYGGGGSGNPPDSGGGGGSGYIGGVTNGITQSGVNSGNGKVKISWKAGNTFEDVLDFVLEHKAELPKTVDGKTNPIFKCTGIYNTHVCNSSCREIKLLNCSEPHHTGQHYDYDNDICWDACGDDNNHKHSVETPVQDASGEFVKNGTFISLDNYFEVYFPNVGDFMGNNCYGISQTTTYRGKGYTDNMSTLEWTREKKVQFSYDVLFNRNGVWEQHMAGEWISLPIYDSNGREMVYYDFYCLLSNDEAIGTGVDFVVEAINCDPSPGGKEDPYQGDDSCDADCIFDIHDGYVTNKYRFSSLEAYHSAYRRTYTDIVGRIGNLIMEDTEDMRFSNLFKQSTADNKWIIEGLLHEVDTSISKNYLAWFNNDGSFAKDIRGATVSKKNQMYNTYGTQKWTNNAGALPFPLEADRNIITSLKNEQLKPGYNALFDISTIGEYRSKIQTVPYFYALNTDTDTLTPIDLYIQMDGGYEPINYFGLMSEYVKEDNTYSDKYYELKDKLYPYIMNLDWKNESLRRNYTKEEEVVTKDLATNLLEYVTDESGNVLTSKYLTIPYGENYALGTLQMLLPETRARTFIGTSKVTSVNINGGTETNIDGSIPNNYFTRNGQRWHLKLGVPSSVLYVPYRNNEHLDPTANVTLSDGTRGKAYEEIERGNYVILMTADIKAIGSKYILGYNQGMNNGKIKVNGKTYSFGDDIPTVLAVYDAKKSSSQDVDFIGTH